MGFSTGRFASIHGASVHAACIRARVCVAR